VVLDDDAVRRRTWTYKNLRWTVQVPRILQQSSLAMFWGWWDHTFLVYQLCIPLYIRGSACAETHYVVRRHTTSDDYVRHRMRPLTQYVVRSRTQCERRFIRSVESNPRTHRCYTSACCVGLCLAGLDPL